MSKKITTDEIKEDLDNRLKDVIASKSSFQTPIRLSGARALYELVSVLEKVGQQLEYANQSSLIDLKAKEADWESKRKPGE